MEEVAEVVTNGPRRPGREAGHGGPIDRGRPSLGRDVPGRRERAAAHARGYDYTATGNPDIIWDDEYAKDGLISDLVTDALALLAAVVPETLEGKAADPYASGAGGRPLSVRNRVFGRSGPDMELRL